MTSVQWRDGQRQQQFLRARPLFFAPLAHGQRRQQEDQQNGHPAEERPYISDPAGKKSFDREER